MKPAARAFALILAGTCLPASLASAQGLRPPGSIPGGGYENEVRPAQAVDAAGQAVRIDRLENQLRQQTGQIEELQFQVKRLEEQLRKFQQDVEFRFQDAGGKPSARPAPASPAPAAAPARRGDLNENGYPIVGQVDPLPPDASQPRGAGPARPGRRGDAFDPDAAPSAPGTPLPLGQTPYPSAPARATGTRVAAAPPPRGPLGDDLDDDASGAPMDLMRGAGSPPPRAPRIDERAPPATQAAIAPQNPAPAAPADAAPATPRDEFNAAMTSLRAGRLEDAETTLRSFLDRHPKDRLAADATFYLGESYFRRQRAREAAEQYLKVSTDFEKSSRAPEALVKLGLSLEKLGAREQACAAYGEVSRKYPAAPAVIRASADKESKRAQC
jgi:tol-pal system protein YbgF